MHINHFFDTGFLANIWLENCLNRCIGRLRNYILPPILTVEHLEASTYKCCFYSTINSDTHTTLGNGCRILYNTLILIKSPRCKFKKYAIDVSTCECATAKFYSLQGFLELWQPYFLHWSGPQVFPSMHLHLLLLKEYSTGMYLRHGLHSSHSAFYLSAQPFGYSNAARPVGDYM